MTWTTQPRSNLSGLAAVTRGAGPTLLLLHGVGLRAEAWGAQLDLPARIVAPDMAGHGESPWSGDKMSLEDYALAALDLLKDLDAPAIVVGHSMGAMLALELASRAPDLVKGVAALNAIFERSQPAQKFVQGRAAQLDGKSITDQTPTLERWFGTAASDAREACASWLSDVNPAAYKCAYTAFATSQSPDRKGLSQVTCPALFITGSEEPNSTPAMSKAMAALAPKGRSIIVDGAAHMMPMTHPNEVNAALVSLISEVSS
ncbi:alpha/beta hydrolase [Octadecabacter sp. CECT 8868]|uniref:alpha/beta fold hydrolase n=1 Tax=Octadecabacter algicola TaxID=2909342 RepID=UPI001F1D4421|nr:alpha/beta hydrolase [Octadecabacter algicola]MCF2904268.1 alpha/beta hydrolase [Octadecabacter algicola]